MTSSPHPVCIVGAGPCGLAAAVALRVAGIDAVVFDRSCIVSAIAGYPTYVTFFSTPEKLTVGDVPFSVAGEKPTRREGLEYYRRVVERYGLRVRQYEDVKHVDSGGSGEFMVHTRPVHGEAVVFPARALIVATGYFAAPNMLGVPGEDLPHVSHRFVEGHPSFQRDCVVVGGGNSAVECALELARCGARVTLIHYESGFVSHVIKPWILPEFEQRVRAGEIVTRFGARVSAIEPGQLFLAASEGAAHVNAQHVFLLTGYTPGPGLLAPMGVEFNPKTGVPAHDPATMETPVRGVFVAGVITSGNKANGIFIENGRGHGALIAAALGARNP